MHRLAQTHGDRIARDHGLTMQQWELLVRLRRAGGSLDQRELCCGFGVALLDRFGLGSAVLANRRARQFHVTRDRTDALLTDQMTAPDLGNHIHEQHPRFSGQTAG